MKSRLFTILFVFLGASVFAQEKQIPVNEKTGNAEYTEVVSVNGVSAAELYERAMVWANEFFPNPSGAIQVNDSAVKISGKHQFRLTMTDKKGNSSPAGMVIYNFTIEFKDGKYRYVIDNINEKKASAYDISNWEDTESDHYQEERYTQFVEQAVAFFNEMIESLVEAMDTPIEEESSDW